MKEGWVYKKFSDVFELQMGKTPSRDNPLYWKGQNTWVSISDLQNKYIDSSKENITDKAVSESNIKIVKKGTVIMSFKLSVGRCAIAAKDLFTNEAIMSFTPIKEGVVLPDYIYYYLKGYEWTGANKAVMGITLNKKSISSNVFAYPPLSEQQRIVSELDLLSSIIEKKKAQLKEYDQLAQSIFYDMFGDPVSNEKGWEVKKLGEVISVKGRVGWKGYKKEDLRESGPLAIGGGHITENGSLDFSSPVYLSMEKYEESPEIMVQRGDLIMVQRGTIGRIGLVKNEIGEATINPCVLILRPLAVSGLYVLHLMLNKIMQRCLQELVRGVAQPMITQKQVNSLIIPLPPLTLQQSFASKIEAIERQKALVRQSITEAETLFNSRMNFWFS